MSKPIISPSILSANFLNIQADIETLNRSEANWVHVDVMDGVFVPNISIGFPLVKQVAEISKKPLDVHLMIVQPEKFIKELKDTGVTLNPSTPVAMLKDIITDVDMVLLMSVNPGFSGQKFIPQTLNKLKELRELIDNSGSHALIQIDGGVNLETGKLLVEAGADVLVAGNAVFKAPDMVDMIHQMKNL